jgi:hypothetical protein
MPVGSVTGSLSHTMKVPVIVACITSGRADWHDVDLAIVQSDNEAALRLWERLDDGPARVEAVLRRAGDDDGTARVLDAMGRIVPEQRLGIGSIPGIRFKGGWGPGEDGGYDVIQVGIAGDAVIALAAHAPDFDAAKELASGHVPQHPNAPQLRASRDR